MYEVKKANKAQTKVFEKVEKVITDELADLIFNEDIKNLLAGKVENEDATKAIEKLGLTVEEICTWYFMS